MYVSGLDFHIYEGDTPVFSCNIDFILGQMSLVRFVSDRFRFASAEALR